MARHMSDFAVYLGEGIWWQITCKQYASGDWSKSKIKIRKWNPAHDRPR